MKTINYKILLIILLIFASCKTEDSTDAGTDTQDVSGQDDVSGQEDVSDISNDVINCIDNDGDQYGQGN